MILNLIYINLFISLVYYLNAPQEMTDRLVEIVTKGKVKKVELKKPWSCATCICFWITLLYLLFFVHTQFLSILFMSVLNGFLTKFTTYIIQLIDRLISHLSMLFERLINKIR